MLQSLFMIIAVFVWLPALGSVYFSYKAHKRLELNHPELYGALGRPSVWNANPLAVGKFILFFMGKKALTLHDDYLAKLRKNWIFCFVFSIFSIISIVIMFLLMG